MNDIASSQVSDSARYRVVRHRLGQYSARNIAVDFGLRTADFSLGTTGGERA